MIESKSAESRGYTVTARNRLKRRHDRGRYDHASVHAILDSGMMCHVAYSIDGQPYCTPTLYWREGGRLYWHGSSASRMLRAQTSGVPVCLTVAHLDGLVLARTGFNHSANYRSVMCFGLARQVEGKEKVAALDAMIERFFPGRGAGLRPFSKQDIKATSVVGMEIEQASAKVRAAGNLDEPEDLSNASWAGVIPVSTVIGTAEPCPHNIDRPVRTGLEAYSPGARLDAILAKVSAL
jgi:nitroimidazol reductase NimA-like FMN-containing flavoprotein (pyridoxamine 5'-phosphate oxidase superfamily)